MYVVPEISDPLRGVIEWGTPGLVGWFALAAVVGMALRTLAGSSAARQRIEPRPATMRGPLGRHRSPGLSNAVDRHRPMASASNRARRKVAAPLRRGERK